MARERANGEEAREHAAREARRAVALAQVRQYPDPVLRLRANEVEEFDEVLAALVERMGRLMRDAQGVGLAANQVGVLQRVFVYQPSEEEPVTALVNPRVVASSEERSTEEEGCLSLANATVVVDVERPVEVTVEARTPAGEPVTVEADGLAARIVQHELDHLDGVLIIDRAPEVERKRALAALRPRTLSVPAALFTRAGAREGA
jgi:peptide deformylase